MNDDLTLVHGIAIPLARSYSVVAKIPDKPLMAGDVEIKSAVQAVKAKHPEWSHEQCWDKAMAERPELFKVTASSGYVRPESIVQAASMQTDKSAERLKAVQTIQANMAREGRGCTYTEAWKLLKGVRPELF